MKQSENIIAVPRGADIFYQGSFYKINATDQVFVYVNYGWILSSRAASEIKRIIKDEGKMVLIH